MTYGAREDYQSEESARTYEARPVYSGLVGRLRNRTERRAISEAVSLLRQDSHILDLPCGNGRWFTHLAERATAISGRDISVGMVKYAAQRSIAGVAIDVATGDAEAINLGDGAVDHVFSFALMKHLPVAVQARVLAEFARVSTGTIICSFALFRPLSRRWWQFRRPPESWPLELSELEQMASDAGLSLRQVIKISQPVVGLEHLAILDHRA